MAYTRKKYREIVEDILEQLTKAVVKEKHDYTTNQVRYRVVHEPVDRIEKVEGLLLGARHIFREDVDYRLVDSMLEWVDGGDRPDDRTPFYVSYIFGEPSGITDINPGSVVRTIVESISREIDYLYAQMDAVYRSGFIDTATGSALDMVVALLGVTRKPPQHAMGKVSFGRSSDPSEISISGEVILYDGRVEYELKNSPVKSITNIQGIAKGGAHVFQQGKDYQLKGNAVSWLPEGQKPDVGSVFTVDYTAYEKISVPVGTTVSTFSRDPAAAKLFVTIEEGILEKIPQGKWEAAVPVRSTVAGAAGNVVSGAVTIMPQPPVGIEYVINKEDIMGGSEAEDDKDLRERAKRALEVVGRATFTSLEAALRGIEGVRSVHLEELKDVPGVVRAVVDGGDMTEIQRVVDDIRAAGIRVDTLRPKLVLLDIKLTLHVVKRAPVQQVQAEVERRIRDYVASLRIEDDVPFNRLVSMALEVEGVRDVTDVTVNAYRKDAEMVTSVRENIVIEHDEKAEVRTVTIEVKGGG